MGSYVFLLISSFMVGSHAHIDVYVILNVHCVHRSINRDRADRKRNAERCTAAEIFCQDRRPYHRYEETSLINRCAIRVESCPSTFTLLCQNPIYCCLFVLVFFKFWLSVVKSRLLTLTLRLPLSVFISISWLFFLYVLTPPPGIKGSAATKANANVLLGKAGKTGAGFTLDIIRHMVETEIRAPPSAQESREELLLYGWRIMLTLDGTDGVPTSAFLRLHSAMEGILTCVILMTCNNEGTLPTG